MSKQVTIKGFVYEQCFGGEKEYVFFNSDTMGDKWYVLVGPAEFSYDIPDSFNPTAARIAALEQEREKVRAEFAKTVKALDDQIANLQAIEYTPEAA